MRKLAVLVMAALAAGCLKSGDCGVCCLAQAGSGSAACYSSTTAPDVNLCEVSADCVDCKGCKDKVANLPHRETELAVIPLAAFPSAVIEAFEAGDIVPDFSIFGYEVREMDPWAPELMLEDWHRLWLRDHGRRILRVTTPRGVTYITGRWEVDQERAVVAVKTVGLAAVRDNFNWLNGTRYDMAKDVYLGLIGEQGSGK
jgi:hypothetical protein